MGGKTDLGVITLVPINRIRTGGGDCYGTQRKVDLNGSVAIVNTDEMKKVSHSNISTMLEVKLPVCRLHLTDSRRDPTVRIRGFGSFGSTAPLYVVDGVPMGTTIRDFSPNDIETLRC